MANSDGLDRMNKLLNLLGNPEKGFKVIHIAGTNGKGSTACMIASILEEAGYVVGLYTSPHLIDYRERMQIWDGSHRLISADKYAEFENKVDEAASDMKDYGNLHVFERLTAIAYLYFAEEKPDYVILECGLGGRLDSTNTIEKPMVSVITQIGLDHTSELGSTIFKITREKTGIIKKDVTVVSQTKNLSAKQIIEKVAKGHHSKYIDSSLERDKYMKYEIGMFGDYQIDNAATAVSAIKAVGIKVSENQISDGLKKANNPGRFEIVSENPLWIVDGAHNIDAIKASIETIKKYGRINSIKKVLILFGCMKDKNYKKMIFELCNGLEGAEFATVTIDDERSADSGKLKNCFTDNGFDCLSYDTVQEAFTEINSNYECVVALGSIYLAGAIKKLF